MGKLTAKDKKELHDLIIPIFKKVREQIIGNYDPINDSIYILEKLGFFILKFPAADDSISGFHIKKNDNSCIYINSAHTLGRQQFSLWHEFYHAYTGEGSQVSFTDKIKTDPIEHKAQCFASSVLMPESTIREYVRRNRINIKYISYEQLIKMQNYFKVSYGAMVIRLKELYSFADSTLRQRYCLSRIEMRDKLISRTIKANGDLKLITPTNDVYVSQSFLQDIEFNLTNDRISMNKAQDILTLLESIGQG